MSEHACIFANVWVKYEQTCYWTYSFFSQKLRRQREKMLNRVANSCCGICAYEIIFSLFMPTVLTFVPKNRPSKSLYPGPHYSIAQGPTAQIYQRVYLALHSAYNVYYKPLRGRTSRSVYHSIPSATEQIHPSSNLSPPFSLPSSFLHSSISSHCLSTCPLPLLFVLSLFLCLSPSLFPNPTGVLESAMSSPAWSETESQPKIWCILSEKSDIWWD